MTVYLDHAATAPLRTEARSAWLEASGLLGNPASTHGSGQRARALLEDARERIAAVLECEPIEVVFTSGGTESINLALTGLWRSRAAGTTAIVLPAGEHHATIDTIAWLADHEGADVRHVGIDQLATIDERAFAFATSSTDAALATAIMANNEAGTLQNVTALSAVAAASAVPLHIDAVAGLGTEAISYRAWRGEAPAGGGLVALSVSGHKIGAPVGTGALVVDRTAKLTALHHGGGGQRSLRAGTQDIAGAAAFAAAVEAAEADRHTEHARLAALRDDLIRAVLIAIPEAQVLGHPTARLAGNVHLHLPGALGESVLFLLDQADISVSTGAACQAGVAEASHVVQAMGRSEREAREVIRLTLGRTSTDDDVGVAVSAITHAYRTITARHR